MSKRANKRTKVRIFRRAFKRCDLARMGMKRPYRFRQGDGMNASKLEPKP